MAHTHPFEKLSARKRRERRTGVKELTQTEKNRAADKRVEGQRKIKARGRFDRAAARKHEASGTPGGRAAGAADRAKATAREAPAKAAIRQRNVEGGLDSTISPVIPPVTPQSNVTGVPDAEIVATQTTVTAGPATRPQLNPEPTTRQRAEVEAAAVQEAATSIATGEPPTPGIVGPSTPTRARTEAGVPEDQGITAQGKAEVDRAVAEREAARLSPAAIALGSKILDSTAINDPANMGAVRSFLKGDTAFHDLPAHQQNAIRSAGLLPEVLAHQRTLIRERQRQAFRQGLLDVANANPQLEINPDNLDRLRTTAAAQAEADANLASFEAGRTDADRKKASDASDRQRDINRTAFEQRRARRLQRQEGGVEARAIERREANLRSRGRIGDLRRTEFSEEIIRTQVQAQANVAAAELQSQLSRSGVGSGQFQGINQGALGDLVGTLSEFMPPDQASAVGLQVMASAASFGMNFSGGINAQQQQFLARAGQETVDLDAALDTPIWEMPPPGEEGTIEFPNGIRAAITSADAEVIMGMRQDAAVLNKAFTFWEMGVFGWISKGKENKLKRGIRHSITLLDSLKKLPFDARVGYAEEFFNMANTFGLQKGLPSGLVRAAFKEMSNTGEVSPEMMARLRKALENLPSILGR